MRTESGRLQFPLGQGPLYVSVDSESTKGSVVRGETEGL